MVYQGLVCHARERVTGRVVALKKSRVSLRVKRTTLEYEANILHLLAGHPSIPTIYAFGQLAHFEYIAIELLGPSLNDALKSKGDLISSLCCKSLIKWCVISCPTPEQLTYNGPTALGPRTRPQFWIRTSRYKTP